LQEEIFVTNNQPNTIIILIQLAFLDNLIAIYQVKASPAGTAIQMWEWKGADLPFGNMLSQS
jgi:hypothetical protein